VGAFPIDGLYPPNTGGGELPATTIPLITFSPYVGAFPIDGLYPPNTGGGEPPATTITAKDQDTTIPAQAL